MSDIAPRRRSNLSHSKRVDRGAHLAIATGVSGTAFVITFLLALVGVLGAGLPFLAALATAGFGFGAYRTIKRP